MCCLFSGLDSLMGVEVRQTLERDYEIQLAMKEVRLLTVNKLRELATSGTKMAENGANSAESTQNSSAHVSIPQINDKTLVGLNDIKNNQRVLFVVHNINGTVEPVRTLAVNLSCPVYGLQYTAEAPKTSVQDLAAFYIKCMREIQPKGPYHLAGYSFGACVAIEMALQLEKSNEVEKLFLLDGSHAYVEARTLWHRKRLIMKEGSWGPEAMAEGLSTLAPQYAKVDKEKLLKALKAETSVEKQIEITAEAIAKASDDSVSQVSVATFLGAFINLLRMGEQYRATAKIHGDVHLVRAKVTDEMGKSLGEDFNLKQVCNGKISLKWVDGDHESFLQGSSAEEVANIITAACC